MTPLISLLCLPKMGYVVTGQKLILSQKSTNCKIVFLGVVWNVAICYHVCVWIVTGRFGMSCCVASGRLRSSHPNRSSGRSAKAWNHLWIISRHHERLRLDIFPFFYFYYFCSHYLSSYYFCLIIVIFLLKIFQSIMICHRFYVPVSLCFIY